VTGIPLTPSKETDVCEAAFRWTPVLLGVAGLALLIPWFMTLMPTDFSLKLPGGLEISASSPAQEADDRVVGELAEIVQMAVGRAGLKSQGPPAPAHAPPPGAAPGQLPPSVSPPTGR
jgi:hypothetical protein